MSRSECYCYRKSCESSTKPNQRFCFEKNEAGCICGGGIQNMDIPTCRATSGNKYFDTIGEYNKSIKTNEKPLNHDQRRKNKRHNL